MVIVALFPTPTLEPTSISLVKNTHLPNIIKKFEYLKILFIRTEMN
ncbi:hypothetical protein BDE27_3422 [Xenorhabdus ehlersii]|uniref:Uncharacterized protein n=1 Tax=Xenorhabdus ehlersii TaxID=290111 RepID=A0A2D0IRH8_9GAMM|nr:hypothetical protein Xehl_02183 [Xenorhabdus ehlersii]PHM25029.1 hypothetical protein Xehl_01818 [Xenorhabdus ehlersii]RKE87880.1 hypothetical protein BDE27_3422 [Xenorhabdus ehlersii]